MNIDTKDLSDEFKESVPEDSNKRYSFDWYLNEVLENPMIARNSHQRVADMFDYYGSSYDEELEIMKYNIVTEDPLDNGKNKFYGSEFMRSVHEFVNKIKSGARRLGTEKRIKLLLGPVGSGKSDFDKRMRKYFEDYTSKEEGRMYTFEWVDLCSVIDDQKKEDDVVRSPMMQDPLVLLPEKQREKVLDKINDNHDRYFSIRNEQDLDPESSFYMDKLLEHYNNDIEKVWKNHINVVRLIANENRRDCIETFEPKDKKNQDESELTGDINYSKIAVYGERDPRSFDYSGALCNANRGIFSGEELLKLQKEFLYDFLHASQEQTIKPKNNPRIDIDQIIVGRTNMPEYLDKKNNEKMEAFNDRTKKVDFPYVIEYEEESKIYEKLLNNADVENFSVEPHTLDMAAMFSVFTRLREPDSEELSMLDKLKAYNNQNVGENIDIEKLKEEASSGHDLEEGMFGISPRFIGDEIAESIMDNNYQETYFVSPLTLFEYFEDNLEDHASIEKERLPKYYKYLESVREEYSERAKHDVMETLTYDEDELEEQGNKYIDHVMAYNKDDNIEDPMTGEEKEPDEEFMRSIEEQLNIPENRKDSFRQDISNWITKRAREDKTFKPQDNTRLREALEKKLWEDKKHNIRLSSLVTEEESDVSSEWIENLKQKGYSEEGAKQVLEYAGAMIARDEKE